MIELFLICEIIWGPEKCISPDTMTPLHPKACVWKDTIHLVFERGEYEVIYLRSVDKGETWDEPKNLTINDPAGAILPDITVWGNKVHVVYNNFGSGADSVMYVRSIDGGTTWEAPRKILRPGHYCTITCRHDTLYLKTNTYVDSPWVVIRSCDGGITWQLLHSFDPSWQGQWQQIEISSSYLHIPTEGLGLPGYIEVYYFYSPDLGNTWVGPIRISPIDNWHSFSPCIAVSDTNVYIFWREMMNCPPGSWENINLRKSHNSGHNFSERIILSNFCHSTDRAAYAKDSIVVVVYPDGRENEDYDLWWRASYDYGNTWTDEERLIYLPGGAVWPELCGWGDDIYLFWVQIEPDTGNLYHYRIYFKKGTYIDIKEKDKEKDNLKIICPGVLFLPSNIKFFVFEGIKYSLNLIDLNGRKIKVLKEGIGKGLENIYLEDIKEGNYFIVLEADEKILKKKITILKRRDKR